MHRRGLRCSGLGEIHEKEREGNGGVETFRVAFLLIDGCCCLAAWRPRGKSTSGVTVTEGGAWQRRSATHEMSMTEQLASGGILQLGVAPARVVNVGTWKLEPEGDAVGVVPPTGSGPHGPEAWPRRGAGRRQDGGGRFCCEARLELSHGGQRSWQVCFWLKHVCLRDGCCGTQGQQLAIGASWRGGCGIELSVL